MPVFSDSLSVFFKLLKIKKISLRIAYFGFSEHNLFSSRCIFCKGVCGTSFRRLWKERTLFGIIRGIYNSMLYHNIFLHSEITHYCFGLDYSVSITISCLSLKQRYLLLVLEQPHMDNYVRLPIPSICVIKDSSLAKFYLIVTSIICYLNQYLSWYHLLRNTI